MKGIERIFSTKEAPVAQIILLAAAAGPKEKTLLDIIGRATPLIQRLPGANKLTPVNVNYAGIVEALKRGGYLETQGPQGMRTGPNLMRRISVTEEGMNATYGPRDTQVAE